MAIDDIVALAVEGASAAGIVSHELEYRAATVARAAASLGFDPAQVLDAWVYGPRRAVPQPPQPSPPPASDRSPSTPSEGEGSGDGPESIDPPTAVPIASAPPRSLPGRTRRPLPGRRGPRAPHPSRGQPGRSLPWNRGYRPDIPATLAWALPRLPLRGWRPGDPVRLSPGDLRRRLRKSRSGRLQLIVLDASGSMARDAIRRAKGVALAILDQAYVERRSVAVVVARGRSAYLALPPTRSTRRVAECLRRLPAGGGTPLASAYLLAARLAERFDPPSVEVLVLTDGRPNVALGPGREPKADADMALAALRARATQVRIQPIVRRTAARA
ncbi:VWA domain-containing protein [Tepidiforma sp.]|uniref:VWA domain-containing protein n=1 Tax=Tepidiforma sp. TaxID=2682230 RepID=UPI002ADE8536|nr:VWA domain-containing protein [Tepidiforma sp.]